MADTYIFKPGVTVSAPDAYYIVSESLQFGMLKKIDGAWYASSETLRCLMGPAREADEGKSEEKTKRAEILDEAKSLTTGDRNAQYGEPIDDFTRIADQLNALGYKAPHNKPMRPHDVSVIQAVVKLSRIVNTPNKNDSWVDLAGYAAVGGEVAEIEAGRDR